MYSMFSGTDYHVELNHSDLFSGLGSDHQLTAMQMNSPMQIG
jgi:hypothetical protein